MSQKQDKHFRKQARKVWKAKWNDFYEDLQKLDRKTRFHIAWVILFRTKVREKKREERLHKKDLAKQEKQNRLDAAERDARRKAKRETS